MYITYPRVFCNPCIISHIQVHAHIRMHCLPMIFDICVYVTTCIQFCRKGTINIKYHIVVYTTCMLYYVRRAWCVLLRLVSVLEL